MIYLVVGRPGEGKGFYLASVGDKTLKKGGQLLADFWFRGARPWLDWSDIATPAFRGATFLADELGATFGARNTLDIDPACFVAATMHRHNHTDVFGCAQHLQFIDINFRRLAHAVIHVKRLGPDGRAALLGKAPRPWRRPWAFRADWFHLDDHDDKGDLLPNKRPFHREWVRWTKARASMYDTTQMMIPPGMVERWRSICATAEQRAALPAMEEGVRLEDLVLESIPVPERVSGREAKKSSQVSAADIAFARGFYDSDGSLQELYG